MEKMKSLAVWISSALWSSYSRWSCLVNSWMSLFNSSTRAPDLKSSSGKAGLLLQPREAALLTVGAAIFVQSAPSSGSAAPATPSPPPPSPPRPAPPRPVRLGPARPGPPRAAVQAGAPLRAPRCVRPARPGSARPDCGEGCARGPDTPTAGPGPARASAAAALAVGAPTEPSPGGQGK